MLSTESGKYTDWQEATLPWELTSVLFALLSPLCFHGVPLRFRRKCHVSHVGKRRGTLLARQPLPRPNTCAQRFSAFR